MFPAATRLWLVAFPGVVWWRKHALQASVRKRTDCSPFCRRERRGFRLTPTRMYDNLMQDLMRDSGVPGPWRPCRRDMRGDRRRGTRRHAVGVGEKKQAVRIRMKEVRCFRNTTRWFVPKKASEVCRAPPSF
jgi:hypothetical protein